MRAAVLALLLSGCSFEHGRSGTGDGGLPGDAEADAPVDAMIDARPPMLIAAYNLNGPAHVGVDFPGMWAQDPGTVCNGALWTVGTVDVSGTVDDVLFRGYQYTNSNLICAIGNNLPAGEYAVTLLFGEVYIGPGCADPTMQRIFDVLVEGDVVEDNLDVVVVGGCCHPSATTPGAPFKRVYTKMITDGTVSVTIRAEPSGAGMLSAIMVQQL